MKHIGLFEGIGGFSYAAKLIGWETIAWCEWNEFGQRVLRHHFPEAEGFGDITKTDFKKYANAVNILTGGFPCQPYSIAGKRLGKEDERHLWPEMLRAVREIQPPWVVGENVLGLLNWNGGLVFDEVQTDLEAQGYEVFPYVLPACGINAPHRRDRIWFIAYNGKINGEQIAANGEWESSEQIESRGKVRGKSSSTFKDGIITDTDNTGNATPENGINRNRTEKGSKRKQPQFEPGRYFSDFPTISPICSGNDGLSGELVGITFPKWRQESLKAYGNAIVPQVALQIFKAIEMMEDEIRNVQPIKERQCGKGQYDT